MFYLTQTVIYKTKKNQSKDHMKEEKHASC